MKVFFDLNNLAMRLLHLPSVEAETESPRYEYWQYLLFDNIYGFLVGSIDHAVETVSEVALVCDGRHYWRRDLYPPYKADRKAKREESPVDWAKAFAVLDGFKDAVRAFLPWEVLQVEGCEADDVIAVLARATDESVIIHSNDCDYLQLASERVRIFNPNHGFMGFPAEVKIGGAKILCHSAEEFLLASILTGQGGKDNVYNVATDTEWPEKHPGQRKPGFGPAAARKLMDAAPAERLEALACHGLAANFARNKTLIDLACIPDEVAGRIREARAAAVAAPVDVHGLLASYDWPSYRARADEVQEVLLLMSGQEAQAPAAPPPPPADALAGFDEFSL